MSRDLNNFPLGFWKALRLKSNLNLFGTFDKPTSIIIKNFSSFGYLRIVINTNLWLISLSRELKKTKKQMLLNKLQRKNPFPETRSESIAHDETRSKMSVPKASSPLEKGGIPTQMKRYSSETTKPIDVELWK